MEKVRLFNLPVKFWERYYLKVIYLVLIGMLRFSAVIVLYFAIKDIAMNVEKNLVINMNSMAVFTSCVLIILLARKEERKTAEITGQLYINRIRSTLLKRMMRTSIREITAQPVGKISAVLSGDLNSLKRWITFGLSRLIVNLVVVLGLIGFMLTIDVTMALLLVVSMFFLLSINMYLGSKLGKRLRQVRNQKVKLNGLVIERLKQIQTLRSSGQDIKEVQKINQQAQKVNEKLIPQGELFGFMTGVAEASGPILAITLMVSFNYSSVAVSFTQVASMLSLVGFLSSPIKELSRVINYYQGAKISLSKIDKLFQHKRIVRGKKRSIKPDLDLGQLKVRQLSYENCFKGVNIVLNTGDRLAITGNNGSGKSTLMALLLGQLKPSSGKIRINGVNPLYISPTHRAHLFGVYRYGEGLMRGTIKENITYRNPDASLKKVRQVLDQCNLTDEIKKLPKGLDSAVNESGTNLSSGQIGRILLARAVLNEPAMLLLDEPESSLDSSGLQALKNIIKSFPNSIVLITHNQEISELCDTKLNMTDVACNKPIHDSRKSLCC